MAFRSAVINVMCRSAEKAARALVRDFGEVEQLQVSRKGPADFVSTADKRAERILVEELRKARPAFGLLAEEGASAEGDGEHRWIIDPLDGTTNFLHGLPHWSISIALERKGEIIAGVVYDPIKDEMFWGEKGSGAFMTSQRLRVSGRRRLEEAVVATGMPYLGKEGHEAFLHEMGAVMSRTAGIRRFGSAALDLAYVAAGRFDAFWERGLNAWDVAAGVLLVSEAGGYVTEIGGGRNPVFNSSILAANTHLHLPLGKVLRDHGADATKPSSRAGGSGQSPAEPETTGPGSRGAARKAAG